RRRHGDEVDARRSRLDAMQAAVERAIAIHDRRPEEPAKPNPEEPVTRDELKDLFDGFDPAEHEDEAKERWSDTDAYRESARRTRAYRKAEWEQLKRESQSIYERLAARMKAGAPPAAPEVQALV